MGKREEIWKSVFEYWWRGWQIMKDKGWYSIMLRDADAGTVCIPLKFRRLGEAKKYCETLDTLVDRKSLPVGYLDKTICAQAANQMGLDHSRLSIADELRELGEEWK